MTKLVYLDSSDFSCLSTPTEIISAQHHDILSLLRARKREGAAKYFMSAIHFSEAVHAATEHKAHALRRAKLMQELCENNLLRFSTELPKFELRKAFAKEGGKLSEDELLSPPGQWFGFDSDLTHLADLRRSTNVEIAKQIAPLPRGERRKLKSMLDLGKKSSHVIWREIVKDGTAKASAEFPFNLLPPEIATDWFLKEISDEAFRARIVAVMNDPYALFNYILDETKKRELFYEIIRNQGRNLCSDMTKMIELMREALTAIARHELDLDLAEMINESSDHPDFLRRTLSTYSEVNCDNIPENELASIVAACPSLATFMAVSKSYLLDVSHSFIARVRSGNSEPKKLQSSDFGDLMHCFYAPYFDIFRCDSRFGSRLKRHQPIQLQIADRITDLPEMLAL